MNNDSQATLVSVNVSPGGIPKSPVEEARVTFDHLEGDGRDHKKHIKPTRAVSLLDMEIIEELRSEGFGVNPGSAGENLTVKGLNVQNMKPGTILRFSGGVEIELTESRKPCFVLDSIDPKFKDKVCKRIGFMARVKKTGVLKAGETIQVKSS